MRAWIVMGVMASVASPVVVACDAHSCANTVPLVELYTAEGCSSCPPADNWLSKLALADTGDVNFLAFHVDYWDDEGWHDRFASPAFSKRQRQRVEAAGNRGGLLGGQGAVFTPQVMVGRTVAAAWREPKKFVPVLQAAQAQAAASLSLDAHPGTDGTWKATVHGGIVGEAPGAQLWLAQYLDGQSTDVRAGENKGVTLHHDHVVSKLWGPWPVELAKGQEQQVSFETPSSRWGLTAFVQDRRGNTLQSLQLASTKCTATN